VVSHGLTAKPRAIIRERTERPLEGPGRRAARERAWDPGAAVVVLRPIGDEIEVEIQGTLKGLLTADGVVRFSEFADSTPEMAVCGNVVPGGGSYWNYHASRLREPLSGLSPSKTQPSSQMISGTAIRLLYGRLLSRKRRLVDDAHGEVFRRAHRTEASGLVCAYARTFSPRNHEAPTGREDSPRGGDTR